MLLYCATGTVLCSKSSAVEQTIGYQLSIDYFLFFFTSRKLNFFRVMCLDKSKTNKILGFIATRDGCMIIVLANRVEVNVFRMDRLGKLSVFLLTGLYLGGHAFVLCLFSTFLPRTYMQCLNYQQPYYVIRIKGKESLVDRWKELGCSITSLGNWTISGLLSSRLSVV